MAPEYYVFTGERIPDHVTHVLIAKALKFVRADAFRQHTNIQEVICHDGVEKIEKFAFYRCPSLRRVVMPGVKEVETNAFYLCRALTHILWGKLERIGEAAFNNCSSLSSIDLPSIKIIERWAFNSCTNLTNAKFGKDLESIRERPFWECTTLERITLPLKDGMITNDNIFRRCKKLDRVDLVEGAILDEIIDALLLEEWKNDMNEEIDSLSYILPNTPAGDAHGVGGKAREIRAWISRVLRKIIHYKAEHRRYLNVAAATLQPALPNDIVLNKIFPFIELPSFTFEGEN